MRVSGVDLLLLALATQRLAALWFEEIARPIREPLARRAGRRGYLAGCALCISVWAAALVTGLWLVPYGWTVDLVLGVSGAALTLEQIMRWLGATLTAQRRAA